MACWEMFLLPVTCCCVTCIDVCQSHTSLSPFTSINGIVMISSWQFCCVSVGLPGSLFLLDFLYKLKVFEALQDKDKHCT